MTRTKSFVRVAGATSCLLATPVLVEATPTEDKYAFLNGKEDKVPDREAVAASQRAKLPEVGLINGPAWPGEDEDEEERSRSSARKTGGRKKGRSSSSRRTSRKKAKEGNSQKSDAGSTGSEDVGGESVSTLLQMQIAEGFEKLNKRLQDVEVQLAEMRRGSSKSKQRRKDDAHDDDIAQHASPHNGTLLRENEGKDEAAGDAASTLLQRIPAQPTSYPTVDGLPHPTTSTGSPPESFISKSAPEIAEVLNEVRTIGSELRSRSDKLVQSSERIENMLSSLVVSVESLLPITYHERVASHDIHLARATLIPRVLASAHSHSDSTMTPSTPPTSLASHSPSPSDRSV
ncbi:unnamed protein product [Amoebophrya sp. A120]|nr:unnamed protein product [Amoebophrya sp. A120]|eukprot:GSA120T00007190001.1